MVWSRKATMIILYPLAGLIGYFGTKYFFPTEEDRILREQEKARKKIEDHIIKDPKVLPDPVDIVPSGGFTPPPDSWNVWCLKFFGNERKYILGGVASFCALAVTARFQGVLAQVVTEALPAINALPLPLAKKLLLGIEKMKLKQILKTLRTGLMSNELSAQEKIGLVKKSLMHLFLSTQNAGAGKVLILFGISAVLSITMANGAILGGALVFLQDIVSEVGLKRQTIEYIVDIYKEYNAPITQDLAKLLKEIGSES